MKKWALVTCEDGGVAVVLTHEIEDFDEDEWKADKQRAWVVYWPMDGENMNGKTSATVEAVSGKATFKFEFCICICHYVLVSVGR